MSFDPMESLEEESLLAHVRVSLRELQRAQKAYAEALNRLGRYRASRTEKKEEHS